MFHESNLIAWINSWKLLLHATSYYHVTLQEVPWPNVAQPKAVRVLPYLGMTMRSCLEVFGTNFWELFDASLHFWKMTSALFCGHVLNFVVGQWLWWTLQLLQVEAVSAEKLWTLLYSFDSMPHSYVILMSMFAFAYNKSSVSVFEVSLVLTPS